MICKKCDIDLNKRAGEMTPEEIQNVVQVISNPLQFHIPKWFLNRQNDFTTGKYTQLYANLLDARLREDIERLKKIRNHRGLRHHWGIRVRGQHTQTSGRGRAVMPSSKGK